MKQNFHNFFSFNKKNLLFSNNKLIKFWKFRLNWKIPRFLANILKKEVFFIFFHFAKKLLMVPSVWKNRWLKSFLYKIYRSLIVLVFFCFFLISSPLFNILSRICDFFRQLHQVIKKKNLFLIFTSLHRWMKFHAQKLQFKNWTLTLCSNVQLSV